MLRLKRDNPAFIDDDDLVPRHSSTSAEESNQCENGTSNGQPAHSPGEGRPVKYRNKLKNRVRFSSIRIRSSHQSTRGTASDASLSGVSKKDILQRRFSDILSYSSRNSVASSKTELDF